MREFVSALRARITGRKARAAVFMLAGLTGIVCYFCGVWWGSWLALESLAAWAPIEALVQENSKKLLPIAFLVALLVVSGTVFVMEHRQDLQLSEQLRLAEESAAPNRLLLHEYMTLDSQSKIRVKGFEAEGSEMTLLVHVGISKAPEPIGPVTIRASVASGDGAKIRTLKELNTHAYDDVGVATDSTSWRIRFTSYQSALVLVLKVSDSAEVILSGDHEFGTHRIRVPSCSLSVGEGAILAQMQKAANAWRMPVQP